MGLSAGFSGDSGRLPRRLEDLHGPWEGVVVLPIHLTWGGVRDFDMSSQRSRLQLYSIVRSQGRPGDMVRLLNARRMAEDWPQLRVLLSRGMRRACERKLGLRAPAARSHSARGRAARG